MGNQDITALRHQDTLDIYVSKSSGHLEHYWVGPATNWDFNREFLADDVVTKCAAVRDGPDLDVFYVSKGHELVHLWCRQQTQWLYQKEILMENVRAVNPTVVRFKKLIDVYCVDGQGRIVRLSAASSTNWEYEADVVLSPQYQSMTGLFLSRNMHDVLELFFVGDGKLVCLSTGSHNDWTYTSQVIFDTLIGPQTCVNVIRSHSRTDVFFCDQQGFIQQLYADQQTDLKYIYLGRIGNGQCVTMDGRFSAIGCGNQMDVYFVGTDTHIYHICAGLQNAWMWQRPTQASNESGCGGICAVQAINKATDVFFIGHNDDLKNLFIGEETLNDWSRSEGSRRQIDKPIIRWQDVCASCIQIGQGYHGNAYLYQELDVAIKRMKNPNIANILNEIKILDRLSALWPNLCDYQLTENQYCKGFAMKKFRGQKPDKLYIDPLNVLSYKPESRVKLVKSIWKVMREIQSLGVCHGDLTLDNILVDQKDKDSEQFEIFVIDFGNGQIFDKNTRTSSMLTGFSWAKPIQSKTGRAYNPSGVNAYQFGRLALHILNKRKFTEVQAGSSKSQELAGLKTLGFHSSVINFVQSLLQPNVPSRVQALLKEVDLVEDVVEEVKPAVSLKPDISEMKKRFHLFWKTKKNMENILNTDLKGIRSLVVSKNKRTWMVSSDESEGATYFYANLGPEIQNNIFFIAKTGAELLLIRLLRMNGHSINNLDIKAFTAGVNEYLGTYTGIECYAALYQGAIPVFDFGLDFGATTGVGTRGKSVDQEILEFGIVLGKRVGVSLFAADIGIDFKRFFTEIQWKTIRDLAIMTVPALSTTNLAVKESENLLKQGREVHISICNYTKFHWKFDNIYLQSGNSFGGKTPRMNLAPGETTEFKVHRKIGVSGLEGYASYTLKKARRHIIFYFGNPLKGGNSVQCFTLKNKQWEQMNRASIFKRAYKSRKVCNEWHRQSEDPDLMKVFQIKSGGCSRSVYFVATKCLYDAMDWSQIGEL